MKFTPHASPGEPIYSSMTQTHIVRLYEKSKQTEYLSHLGSAHQVFKHRNELVCCQRRLRQYLHFCTSKASKLSTANELLAQYWYFFTSKASKLSTANELLAQYWYFFTSKASKLRTANELLAQYLYFFTSKASKLRTCENVLHIQPQTLEEVDVAALVHAHLHHTSAYVSIRQQTCAYVSIRSIRQSHARSPASS